ncbi:hypothetical protein [Microvirga sp. P5_D2]
MMIALLSLLGAHCSLWVQPSKAQIIVGVNRTNLAWEPKKARSEILSAIAEAGIRSVRLTWREPNARMLDVLDQAANSGVAVLIQFPLGRIIATDGSTMRPSALTFGSRVRLSDISLKKYENYVARALDEIQRRPIRVVALQVGNEINWADFNGDLPIVRPGLSWSRIEDMPDPARSTFEKGIRVYAQLIAITQRLRDSRPNMQRVPIITAGLTDISASWLANRGGTHVAGTDVLKRLLELGIGKYSDGIAWHVYSPFAPHKDLGRELKEKLKGCGTAITGGHPCWITEFGASVPNESCDVEDALRRLQINIAAEVITNQGSSAVAGAMYYDWDQSKSRGLVRCGRVSKAVEALVDWSRTSR